MNDNKKYTLNPQCAENLGAEVEDLLASQPDIGEHLKNDHRRMPLSGPIATGFRRPRQQGREINHHLIPTDLAQCMIWS